MPITGSQQAPLYSIVGLARVGAIRSGYFDESQAFVVMSGAVRAGIEKSTLRINERTGGEPNTAKFTLKGGGGYVPSEGHAVTVGHGTSANVIFSGRARKVTRRLARHVEKRPEYEIDCIDHSYELNTARVANGYVSAASVSASLILHAILHATSPSVSGLGFTTPFVDPNLVVVNRFEVSPTEDLLDAIDRLCGLAGATWYVDYQKQIHAFFSADLQTHSDISTVQPGRSGYWDVERTTDLSNVFTQVNIVGGGSTLVTDILASHEVVPLQSADNLWYYEEFQDAIVPGLQSTYFFFQPSVTVLLGTEVRSTGQMLSGRWTWQVGEASTFLPTNINAQTLVIASANVSSYPPTVRTQAWVQAAGQWLYLSSRIGLYSFTANSIGYAYSLPSSGPGAVQALMDTGTRLSASVNLEIEPSASDSQRVIPSGTRVRNYATFVNSSGAATVASLMGGGTGLVPRTIDDGTLSARDAFDVSSAALQRGAIEQWTTVSFKTTDRHVRIGADVPFSLTSPGEPSGPSITGSYRVQELTIDDFANMAGTRRGPRRTAKLGPVKPPSLWNLLRGL